MQSQSLFANDNQKSSCNPLKDLISTILISNTHYGERNSYEKTITLFIDQKRNPKINRSILNIFLQDLRNAIDKVKISKNVKIFENKIHDYDKIVNSLSDILHSHYYQILIPIRSDAVKSVLTHLISNDMLDSDCQLFIQSDSVGMNLPCYQESCDFVFVRRKTPEEIQKFKSFYEYTQMTIANFIYYDFVLPQEKQPQPF